MFFFSFSNRSRDNAGPEIVSPDVWIGGRDRVYFPQSFTSNCSIHSPFSLCNGSVRGKRYILNLDKTKENLQCEKLLASNFCLVVWSLDSWIDLLLGHWKADIVYWCLITGWLFKMYKESNIKHKNFPLSVVRLSFSDYPPWILKRAGLESSGHVLISSNGKTNRRRYTLRGNKYFWNKFKNF